MTDKKKFLSAADILAGGDNPFREVVIPALTVDGEAGVLRLKPLTARSVLAFGTKMKDVVGSDFGVEQLDAMLTLISESIVDGDGARLFTRDEVEKLQEVNFTVFTALSNAVVAGIKQAQSDGAEGKGSGEASGSASPTN